MCNFKGMMGSLIISLLIIVPGFADSPNRCSCDPGIQTQALHARLESLRNQHPQVSLSFTGRYQSFLVYHSESQLKLRDCTYDVASDTTGLIDILLATQIRVGYPTGWENAKPEARFGVYFGADSPDGLDLWFSNAMAPQGQPMSEAISLGQSHDRGEVTAYKIIAAPALRDRLWEWVHAHGHPRQNTATECQTLEKLEHPQQPLPR